MRSGSLDFVEYASQVRHNNHAQLYRCTGSHSASIVECGNQAVQRIVLAKEKNVVLAAEVVVKICRRKRRGCRDVAHPSLRESAYTELSSRGAQDLQAADKITPPQMAVPLIFNLAV